MILVAFLFSRFKLAEFLDVVFNVIEKRGPVFLLLVFASFIKMPLGKPSGVFAYTISRKQSEA